MERIRREGVLDGTMSDGDVALHLATPATNRLPVLVSDMNQKGFSP